jgi:hypothetical protein
MKTIAIGEAKINFLAIPEEEAGKRKIGILDGKIKIKFSDDFEMTTEELLEMQ